MTLLVQNDDDSYMQYFGFIVIHLSSVNARNMQSFKFNQMCVTKMPGMCGFFSLLQIFKTFYFVEENFLSALQPHTKQYIVESL